MGASNSLPQWPVPKHKISDDSDPLWNQLALSMAYQKVNLLRSCKLSYGNVREESLLLLCCYTLVDVCCSVKTVVDQLVGLD